MFGKMMLMLTGALLVSGCASTATTPAPAPTPQITYVTPSPTPNPTATPTSDVATLKKKYLAAAVLVNAASSSWRKASGYGAPYDGSLARLALARLVLVTSDTARNVLPQIDPGDGSDLSTAIRAFEQQLLGFADGARRMAAAADSAKYSWLIEYMGTTTDGPPTVRSTANAVRQLLGLPVLGAVNSIM